CAPSLATATTITLTAFIYFFGSHAIGDHEISRGLWIGKKNYRFVADHDRGDHAKHLLDACLRTEAPGWHTAGELACQCFCGYETQRLCSSAISISFIWELYLLASLAIYFIFSQGANEPLHFPFSQPPFATA
ncbi:hypothetical protein EDB87DRAFT_1795824, partial [Lactarius vividus]